MINFRDKEERKNGLKTFFIGGTFIMCLWVGGPYLIRIFIDPFLGGFEGAFWRVSGWILTSVGYILAVWCVMLFIKEGKGTPLPYAHPKVLISSGPYRYVRNPMVMGTVLVLLGSALLLGSWGILAYAIAVSLVMHFFVLIEERALTARFGEPYVVYLRRTPRWYPRLPHRS